jgi:hypothetical protein
MRTIYGDGGDRIFGDWERIIDLGISSFSEWEGGTDLGFSQWMRERDNRFRNESVFLLKDN